jgi:hypothetical protein
LKGDSREDLPTEEEDEDEEVRLLAAVRLPSLSTDFFEELEATDFCAPGMAGSAFTLLDEGFEVGKSLS